jgi:DNA-binding transcriptional MerR regulator
MEGSSSGASLLDAMATERLRAVPDDRSAESDSPNQLTIEQLAAESGMSVRNIRAHQARGLLSPPEVRQRVGYYGPDHVARLRLITELQADGFNLKGIERLLSDEEGASEAMLSFRRAITAPFEDEQPEMITAEELAERFPGEQEPAALERAVKLGLLTPVGDAGFEVPSPRLFRIAEEVVERGVPMEAALDVVEVMRRSSRYVADAFTKLFLDSIWKPFEDEGRPKERWPEVLEAIERLRPIASQALVAVFQMTMTQHTEDAFGKELDRMSGEKRRR